MPTLLNQEGFKFFFYANEHNPRHIHVMHANGYAKIELGTMRVVRSTLKRVDRNRALEIAQVHNATFERKWDEFFHR